MAQAYKMPEKGKSVTQEEGGVGTAGLYRHPESGKEAICQYDPLFGNAQANAFERLGFEFVREARPDEIKTVELTAVGVQADGSADMKGVNARLSMLEGVAEQNKNLQAELDKMKAERAEAPKDQTEVSGNHAIANAVTQTNERAQGDQELTLDENKDLVATDKAPEASETATDENADEDEEEETSPAVDKSMSRDKLNEVALAEGLEDAADEKKYETKADLVKAIEDNRAEKAAAADTDKAKEESEQE